MTLRTLELNGAEVTVNDSGAGDPAVLLHGLLGDHRTWRRQVEALAPRYRVLALSPRYYLPNRWPDDGAGFGMASHAADVVALVREWGLPPVHLLGHSYGGGVAALVAMQ